MDLHCIHLGIEVHAVPSPAPEVEPEPEPEQKQCKFKWTWRTNMLALPKWPIKKWVPAIEAPPKPLEELDAEIVYWSDQIAIPRLWKLKKTQREMKTEPYLEDKIPKGVDNQVMKSFNSYYNYYVKKFSEKRIKQMKAKKLKQMMKKQSKQASKAKAGKKEKEPTEKELEQLRDEHFGQLARPKPLLPPAPPFLPKQWRPLEELQESVNKLAEPKTCNLRPPREYWKIRPGALLYNATDNMKKLALSMPHKRKGNSIIIIPGVVKRAALTAIMTPRLAELAKPSTNAARERKQEDDKFDPWVINPNALKYRATARILELARPLERE